MSHDSSTAIGTPPRTNPLEAGFSITWRRPSRATTAPKRHDRRRRAFHLALGISVPLVLLGLWELSAQQGWISTRDFPPPTRIAEKAWHMLTDSGTVVRNGRVVDDGRIYGVFGNPPPTIWDMLWVSAQRVLIGFVLGTVAGVVLGVLMGMINAVRAAFEPLFNALYTVPKLVLTPIFFAIWGIQDDRPLYAVTGLTTFFFMWISTMTAVMAVPESYREAGRSFGGKGWKMFRHVTWPASLPGITVGLRIAAGVSVLVVLSAELLLGANGSGVGTMINNSKDLSLYDQMYVGIILAAIMGVVFTAVVSWISKRFVRWAPEGRAIRAV